MPARNPEEICSLFKQYMAEGDFDGLLSVYDPEVVFLNQAGELIRGKQELKQELNRFAAARARFDFNIAQVIQSDDIALMHHPVEYLRTSADIRVRNRGRTVASQTARGAGSLEIRLRSANTHLARLPLLETQWNGPCQTRVLQFCVVCITRDL